MGRCVWGEEGSVCVCVWLGWGGVLRGGDGGERGACTSGQCCRLWTVPGRLHGGPPTQRRTEEPLTASMAASPLAAFA